MSFTLGQRVSIAKDFKAKNYQVNAHECGKVIKLFANGSISVVFGRRIVRFDPDEFHEWIVPASVRRVVSAALPSYQEALQLCSSASGTIRSQSNPPSYQEALLLPGCLSCIPARLETSSRNPVVYLPPKNSSTPPQLYQRPERWHKPPSNVLLASPATYYESQHVDQKPRRRGKPATRSLPRPLAPNNEQKPPKPKENHTSQDDEKKIDTEEDGRHICMICMDREKNTALIPCGHRFCDQCAKVLKKCPMDRSIIKDRLRTYD